MKLYNVFQVISQHQGYGIDWKKLSASAIKGELKTTFPDLGIDQAVLDFNAHVDLQQQASYQLWHLLYAAEEDFKVTKEDRLLYGNSNVSLKKKLLDKFGFEPQYGSLLANISLIRDYGNLSTKAIKNILPYLEEGHIYSEACKLAGYNHSNSLDKDAMDNRVLKPN